MLVQVAGWVGIILIIGLYAVLSTYYPPGLRKKIVSVSLFLLMAAFLLNMLIAVQTVEFLV